MSYRLSACIENYDVEGVGETWEEMLTAFALDCRKSATSYQELMDALTKEAERAERLAKEGKDGV